MDKLKIRFTEKEDCDYLKKWLSDKDILKWFPMYNEMEIDDAVRIWIAYSKINASLTALINKKPVGSALLYVQSFEKVKHHALFAIIVDSNYRNKGIGTKLINELIILAKEKFELEFLNLEVYAGNP
ncbi:MAG: GNAT family N-acetyltransferase, partial [Chlamydiae bacterium RIFCSPLOWO2_01_FULL_28_7]